MDSHQCLSWLLAKHVYLLFTWQMTFCNTGSPVCLVLLIIFALSPFLLHCPSAEHLSNLAQVCNLHGVTLKLHMEGFCENQTGPLPENHDWKAKSPWLFCSRIVPCTCEYPVNELKKLVTKRFRFASSKLCRRIRKSRSVGTGVLWKKGQERHFSGECLSVF